MKNRRARALIRGEQTRTSRDPGRPTETSERRSGKAQSMCGEGDRGGRTHRLNLLRHLGPSRLAAKDRDILLSLEQLPERGGRNTIEEAVRDLLDGPPRRVCALGRVVERSQGEGGGAAKAVYEGKAEHTGRVRLDEVRRLRDCLGDDVVDLGTLGKLAKAAQADGSRTVASRGSDNSGGQREKGGANAFCQLFERGDPGAGRLRVQEQEQHRQQSGVLDTQRL